MCLEQVEEVRELVDSELGFQQATLSCLSQSKTYMFISNEKKIVGCLIAEHIKKVKLLHNIDQAMLIVH